MRSFTSGAVCLAIILIGLGAGGCAGKYDDYRDVLAEEEKAMGEFIAEAKQAVSAETLKTDIARLNDGMRDLAEKMNKLEKDHPDLPDLESPPPELKTQLDELGKTMSSLDRLLKDKEKLFADPQVKKALNDLKELRGSLGL